MIFSRADFMTEAKLAILYLLDKNGVRMTFDQILECMSGNDLMNYFDIKEALADLGEKGLVYTHNENGGTLYSSSLSGRIHLSEFRARIPASVREQLDMYIENNSLNIRRENEHMAQYMRMPDGSYIAQLSAKDVDYADMDIQIRVQDMETAKLFCSQWRKKAGKIYSFIIQNLSGSQ